MGSLFGLQSAVGRVGSTDVFLAAHFTNEIFLPFIRVNGKLYQLVRQTPGGASLYAPIYGDAAVPVQDFANIDGNLYPR